MATLTTKKETAVKRLHDKLAEGKNLKSKASSEITLDDYSNLIEEFETWRSSVANTLRQIFSDNLLAENFLADEDVLVSTSQSLQENVRVLTKDIKSSIAKIEHILSDVESDLYYPVIDTDVRVATIGLWQSIIIAIITAAAGIVTGYLASPNKPEPAERQLGNVTLEGKWKYICTSFDGSYQHGGRFQVQKASDGSLYLIGERMWRDTYDSISKSWVNKDFNEADYLQWRTNWIYVNKDSEMYFEYEIPTQKNGKISGYCSGTITSQNGKVEYVKGNFYVLNAEQILKGQIIFKIVSDDDYNSKQTLPKNH